jgi:hypothetical protein
MDTIIDGAKETLKDAAKGLQATGINDYIVIGGWCPYLNHGEFYHPGTIDVDILFNNANEEGYLRKYIEYMMRNDYFTSAKHQFQLLTIKEISNTKFCFNIDLLHTAPTLEEAELFVDHLDLNILMSKEDRKRIKMKSIVQKESEILFNENMYEEHSLSSDLKIKIVDFTGMFITKTTSCQKVKRDRDSYDIYLGFIQNKIDLKKVLEICKRDQRVHDSVDSFKKFLVKEQQTFNKRVKYFNKEIKGSPAQNILIEFEKIEKNAL